MKYQIKTLEMVQKNPIEPAKLGPMAPNKPVVNRGMDEIAVYPANGSMNDAVKIPSQKWALLPPTWVNVMVRPAGEKNVHLSCDYTVLVEEDAKVAKEDVKG